MVGIDLEHADVSALSVARWVLNSTIHFPDNMQRTRQDHGLWFGVDEGTWLHDPYRYQVRVAIRTLGDDIFEDLFQKLASELA